MIAFSHRHWLFAPPPALGGLQDANATCIRVKNYPFLVPEIFWLAANAMDSSVPHYFSKASAAHNRLTHVHVGKWPLKRRDVLILLVRYFFRMLFVSRSQHCQSSERRYISLHKQTCTTDITSMYAVYNMLHTAQDKLSAELYYVAKLTHWPK